MKMFNPLSVVIAISLILAGCASKPTNPTGDFVGTTIENSPTTSNEEISFAVGGRYQVKTGDTVSGIAKKFNMDWRELSKFNHLDSKHTIYAGQWLNIPAQAITASTNQAPLSEIRTSTLVQTPPVPVLETITTTNQTPPPAPQLPPVVVQTAPAPVLEVAVSTPEPNVVVETVASNLALAEPTPTPVVVSAPVAPIAIPALSLGFNPTANANPAPAPVPAPSAPEIQAPSFTYPVGQDNLVVKGFGVPIPSGKTEGIFFVGNVGDAIVASETGTVVYANAHPTATNRPMVVIDHNNGYVSTYFDVGTILVKVGDSVKKGDRLGGMTPQTKSGKALFEFRIAQNGRYIDPMGVIKWNGVPSGI